MAGSRSPVSSNSQTKKLSPNSPNVKGIGEGTVPMFLMFCVGRLDVLPVGDLGIRNGIRDLYGYEQTPTPSQVKELAARNHWHPYESVASWYIWESYDTTPLK